jgi:hypothetical protein
MARFVLAFLEGNAMTTYRPLVAMALCGAIAAVMSGCNQSVSALETRSPPQPLPSVPLEPVESTQLDPAIPANGQPGGDPLVVTGDPAQIGQGDRMASLDQGDQTSLDQAPAGAVGETLSREALAGTWAVTSDNPDCRIILAFTKWSGGYRAATRRCESQELTAVTAWDVQNDKVVLVDGNGQTVASLYSTGAERYDGSTAGGMRISFSR